MTAPVITKNCPTCGAPITREDLSLCSYCGAPLQLGGAKETPEGEENPNTARLNSMQEKDDWAGAMAWEPLDTSRSSWSRDIVLPLIAGSVTALVFSLLLNYVVGLIIGSLVLIALFAPSLRRPQTSPRNPDASLLKRAAIVLDRRSETEIENGEGCTTYFFTLEFADGLRGEFCFPGRGASFDLMTVGATGVAYSRGADLLAFKKIRV